MSDKSSEMPKELKTKRDELASYHVFQMMRTMEGASPNTRCDYKDGFDKCYELMSEREAKLKAEIEKAVEHESKLIVAVRRLVHSEIIKNAHMITYSEAYSDALLLLKEIEGAGNE